MTLKEPTNALKSPRVKFEVTQEIIDMATPKDSSHCMIADALASALPTAKYISVDLATIRFTDPLAGIRYVYLTPRSAQAALLDFDKGEKPEPFSVTLQYAHVLPSGTGSKARAELKTNSAGGGTIPVRVGGKTPPEGPLYGESVDSPVPGGKRGGTRSGRRREFGLRAIIR